MAVAGDLEALPLLSDPMLETSAYAAAGGGGGGHEDHHQLRLHEALRRLEDFLSLLGFCSSDSSRLRLVSSASAFLALGIASPLVAIYLIRSSLDSSFGAYQMESFELTAIISQVSLAALSLGCVSWNLFKYGVRRFLFFGKSDGQVERFQSKYAHEIQDFFYLLSWWILPCFIVKFVLGIIQLLYISHESNWKLLVAFSASMISWVYLTTVLLSACGLFSLLCSLQSVHFEAFDNLLKRYEDPSVCFEEHAHLRHSLSKISHRFRIFLLVLFLFVTASQFVTLLQTTAYEGTLNFRKTGDIVVSSVVQVVAVVLCLYAASRISHRAQSIVSIASKCHASLTCHHAGSTAIPHFYESAALEEIPTGLFSSSSSENDLESTEYIRNYHYNQLDSPLLSYQRRQALVMYLQSNPGGITIFGWTIDRSLINTIFLFELTLMLFVLSLTIVLHS